MKIAQDSGVQTSCLRYKPQLHSAGYKICLFTNLSFTLQDTKCVITMPNICPLISTNICPRKPVQCWDHLSLSSAHTRPAQLQMADDSCVYTFLLNTLKHPLEEGRPLMAAAAAQLTCWVWVRQGKFQELFDFSHHSCKQRSFSAGLVQEDWKAPHLIIMSLTREGKRGPLGQWKSTCFACVRLWVQFSIPQGRKVERKEGSREGGKKDSPLQGREKQELFCLLEMRFLQYSLLKAFDSIESKANNFKC